MTEAAFTQTLAERIRTRRIRLGMTQYGVALAIGVKRSSVCAWERGERTVSAFDAARLDTFFAQREQAAAAADRKAKR